MRKSVMVFAMVLLSLTTLQAKHEVYVIHGFCSARIVMHKINRYLQKAHYTTKNYGYKSIDIDLDSLGKQLYFSIKKSGYDSISFVTHSMGALVVRSMLKYSEKDSCFPHIYRIVMLAPPNKGAEIADVFSSKKFFKRFFDPNISKMKTDSNSYTNKLPIPKHSEIGLIVGIRGNKKGYSQYIKNDNDGALTPTKAYLGIEKDAILIKKEHTLMTQSLYVCRLIAEFLKQGVFISRNEK